MRAVAASSQGPPQQYNQVNSPNPHVSESDGKGGPATPAFEAHVNNTPGTSQLSLHPLQRGHSSKSVPRHPANAQNSPSMAEFSTPQAGPSEQTGPTANGEMAAVSLDRFSVSLAYTYLFLSHLPRNLRLLPMEETKQIQHPPELRTINPPVRDR